MCGIIGYVGKKNAAEILYEGLLRLEYRGYDSAGIAVKNGEDVTLIKKSGRVACLLPEINGVKGNLGIGHTRWATHGKPSYKNAHPHAAGDFYIVHNGIIENFTQIKTRLIKDGCEFLSDTDSEVIVRLINSYKNFNFLNAVAAAVNRLKGSFAILAISKKENKIIAVCNKSPVIVGFGTDGNYVCSDALALAGIADKICILKDGDIAEITAGGVQIYNFDLQPLIRKKTLNSATRQSMELGGCPHYMLKEIYEIPQAVKNTVASATNVDINGLCRLIKDIQRIIIVGCGTAYHAGLVAKDWFEEIAKIPSVCETASEWRYKSSVADKKTLVVAVSQSGETADTLEAVKKAKSLEAAVIAVTNVGYSAITRLSDFVMPVSAGAEICVAATKSYCGQLVSLYVLAVILKEKVNYKNSPLLSGIYKLPEQCKQVVSGICADELAEKLAKSNGVYFIGRGLDGAVAKEGSLKLKEVSLKSGEGYPAGELKHGTLALIDDSTYTVCIVCNKALSRKTLSAMEQISTRGGKLVAVCSVEEILPEIKNMAEYVFVLPDCGEYLSPVVSVIPLQIIAYKTALKCNCNPDKPRNLAKSVTVE